MSVCTHGMPDPAACVECMFEGNIEPQRVEPEQIVGTWVRARFDGQCPACDPPIRAEHDLIVKTNRDRWLHAGCAP